MTIKYVLAYLFNFCHSDSDLYNAIKRLINENSAKEILDWSFHDFVEDTDSFKISILCLTKDGFMMIDTIFKDNDLS